MTSPKGLVSSLTHSFNSFLRAHKAGGSSGSQSGRMGGGIQVRVDRGRAEHLRSGGSSGRQGRAERSRSGRNSGQQGRAERSRSGGTLD